jgi:hypothetical protein
MSSGEQALMCVLMLRGAQTPGELKQRGERIHSFPVLDDVHATLDGLIERGLVARLDRRPGQKEERYEQLLGADTEHGAGASERGGPPAVGSTPAVEPAPSLSERVARLEREVAELRTKLAEPPGGGRDQPAQGGERESREVEHEAPEPRSVGATWRGEAAPAP